MNVLFLTLLDFQSYDEHNIYTDLIREFIKQGHQVYCISPSEKRCGVKTHYDENTHLLKLRIGNTQKTNILEKGISTICIEPQFVSAIKKYFSTIKFDIVLYSTPPITFYKSVAYVKKRDHAKTYLLLKDIFPQNAVDLGMMNKTGLKSIIYKYFRKKEKKLYSISDKIGCMSQANEEYIIKHNAFVDERQVEVCPNSVELCFVEPMSEDRKSSLRKKYGIPEDRTIFIYGGNLGKPQDIPFIIDCLKANAEEKDRFFIICGSGIEFFKLKGYIDEKKPKNVLLLNGLPKEEYDRLVGCCDVGMIFLDHRFTIPNFPSRLLSYMQNSMPVIACTDLNTDIGRVITKGGFGWWCESDSAKAFTDTVNKAVESDLSTMGKNAYQYLCDNYTAEIGYKIIMEHLNNENTVNIPASSSGGGNCNLD